MKIIQLTNGKEVTLRSAKVSDAGSLKELLQQVAKESTYVNTTGYDYFFKKSETKKYIRSFKALKQSLLLLAFWGDEIIASFTCLGDKREKLNHSAELGMGIRKEFWGQGLGSALLDFGLSWARQVGLKKVNLSVRCDNEAAIALYRKFGFKIEGERSRFHYIDGEYYSAYFMGRILDNVAKEMVSHQEQRS